MAVPVMAAARGSLWMMVAGEAPGYKAWEYPQSISQSWVLSPGDESSYTDTQTGCEGPGSWERDLCGSGESTVQPMVIPVILLEKAGVRLQWGCRIVVLHAGSPAGVFSWDASPARASQADGCEHPSMYS